MTTTATTTNAWAIAWARMTGHPTRVRILEIFERDGVTSPSALAELLDERLGNVSYHVRTLLDNGFLRLVRTEPRRGAVEHFYDLDPDARAARPNAGPPIDDVAKLLAGKPVRRAIEHALMERERDLQVVEDPDTARLGAMRVQRAIVAELRERMAGVSA